MSDLTEESFCVVQQLPVRLRLGHLLRRQSRMQRLVTFENASGLGRRYFP